MKMNKLDIKKVMGETPKNGFEASDNMIKAQQNLLEALHIMQSTIHFFNDSESLNINKDRMIKFVNKFI